MIITVDAVGDLEVEPGTPLQSILDAAAAPAARWCGGVRLDLDHRAGRAPLTHGSLLAEAPQPEVADPHRPHLAVIAGPDAGASLAPRSAATVGRAHDAALRIDDPALSGRHLLIDAHGRAKDLGSTNGSVRIREGRRRAVGRLPRQLRDGDLLAIGATLLAWRDPRTRPPAPATRPAPAPALSLAGAGGAIAGGAAIAVVTGRWWWGAVLAVPPVVALAASWWRRRERPSTPPDGLDAIEGVATPIAIVGTPQAARAAARAVAVASALAWADDAWDGVAHEGWRRWMATTAGPRELTISKPGSRPPSDAATVIDVDAGTLEVAGETRPWTPALVAAGTAERIARARTHDDPGPREVWWGELTREWSPEPRSMAVAIGRDAHGSTVTLDLDRDGPHVLVAGTTGAGKSLLLETLVAGLAHDHGPSDLAIALIDFKGGAGLGPCMALPQVAGTLTDLEPSQARRALLGLDHELRERKRSLLGAGLSSWQAWEQRGGAPPRLVVVIDEFQELAAADAGFLTHAARLAAQGRSLGMHLVLATQRPAGAVTPQIRANVGTVIALRVTSAAESHDLIGDDAAARLPAARPGLAILASPVGRATFQVALPVADQRPPARLVARGDDPDGGRALRHRDGVRALAQVAAGRWPEAAAPARLWLPPLSEAPEPPPGAAGWLDLADRRRRIPLTWDPGAGPALVIGARGTERARCVAAIAATAVGAVILPRGPREAVRTLELAAEGGAAAVAIDDAELAAADLEAALRAPGELALESYARRVPLILGCGAGWPARWSSRAALRVVLPDVDPATQTLWGVPAVLRGSTGDGAVAIGTDHAAACRLRSGTRDRLGRQLVVPLVCPTDLSPEAVGVIGDLARPVILASSVTVVGTPSSGRDHAVDAARSSGSSVTVSTAPPPGAGGDLLLVDAEPTLLRAWGIRLPPGEIEPHAPPGRVLLVREGRARAVQLRPRAAVVSGARSDHVT